MLHKLRPAGQIWPATSRLMARKVHQVSLKYEKKHGIPYIA